MENIELSMKIVFEKWKEQPLFYDSTDMTSYINYYDSSFVNCPFFDKGKCSISRCAITSRSSKKDSGVPYIRLCRNLCSACCGWCIKSVDLCPQQHDMNGVELTIFKNYVHKLKKNNLDFSK